MALFVIRQSTLVQTMLLARPSWEAVPYAQLRRTTIACHFAPKKEASFHFEPQPTDVGTWSRNAEPLLERRTVGAGQDDIEVAFYSKFCSSKAAVRVGAAVDPVNCVCFRRRREQSTSVPALADAPDPCSAPLHNPSGFGCSTETQSPYCIVSEGGHEE